MMRTKLGSWTYALQERLVRRKTFARLKDMEHTQWLARAEIEALQARRLNDLLRGALSNSRWHARRITAAGLGEPVAVGSLRLDDLRKLPRMTREDARLNREELVWRAVPGGAYRYNTGGSTGEPLVFYYGRARQAADAAGRMRARRWWGVQVGQPEVYLWGAPVELSKTDRIKVIRDRLINQLLLNAFEMSPRQMDEYIEAMEAWRPCSIYGYASSLALLAAHADRRGRRLNLSRLRVVNATGETLYPHQRELIERMFGVPAAVEYGARDAGLIALTSPKGQNLLMSETIILEVLDEAGAPVAHGKVGEAVITNLDSEAQPFIRYRTGDMVRRTQEPCIDGRGLHVLSDIEGRKTDFIVRADGTVMHALALIYVIRNTEGVAQFKCIQHTVRDLEVLVVPDGRWSESSAQAIKAGLRQRLGDDLRIELGICDAIAPEASGKHRYVVSRVVLDDSLQRAVTA